MSNGEVIPAAAWNGTCWYINAPRGPSVCEYATFAVGGGAVPTVSVVNFDKFTKSRLVDLEYPSFDKLAFKAYGSEKAVRDALLDGSLHLSYGAGANPPSQFIRLATDSGNGVVTAHEDAALLNTRLIVLNSAGQLNTTSLRQMVMGMLYTEATKPLEEGELATETPQGTTFALTRPYCSPGPTNSIQQVVDGTSNCAARAEGNSATSCATTSLVPSGVGTLDNPLRFMYVKTIPHNNVIASEVVSNLYANGVYVYAIPLEKDEYNAMMNTWTSGGNGASGDNNPDCGYLTPTTNMTKWSMTNRFRKYTPDDPNDKGCISFDIAIGETWGPPYDATSKLFDMTYEWGSGEADNVATSNLEQISKYDFNQLIQSLPTIEDPTTRQNKYNEVLNILQDSGVFLPLTAKQNLAVVSDTVGGFKFGFQEFDIPVAGLYVKPPAPPPSNDDLSDGAIVGIAVASAAAVLLLLGLVMMAVKERAGTPIFAPMNENANSKGGNNA
jgi:hypothetical protein